MGAAAQDADADGGFALAASAHGGAVRLRAAGRRSMVADHHEHLLHLHVVLEYERACPPQGRRRRRRVLRGNRSGSAAEFLALRPDRRAAAVARLVWGAGFPAGCAGEVERFCARAAALGRERGCDDVTVTVDWTPARAQQEEPRDAREEVAAEDDAVDLSSLAGIGVVREFPGFLWFLSNQDVNM